MIAVDTNVIVRFLTKDDPDQYEKAFTLFNTETVFIPDTVVLETEWVLRFSYRFSRNQIAKALKKLVGFTSVHVEDEQKITQSIVWYEDGFDFADAFHLANCQHLTQFVTFDEKFVKRANGQGHCLVRRL